MIEQACSHNKTNIAPERGGGWISDYSGVDTEQDQRSGIHTETLLSIRWCGVGLCASIFQLLLSCLTHDGKHRDIGEKKSNCFSIAPSAHSPCASSMWGPYINTDRTHPPEREGMHQDAVSGLASIQHFMPGVSHQPSHHSAVKCQQSQIPQPSEVLNGSSSLLAYSLCTEKVPLWLKSKTEP